MPARDRLAALRRSIAEIEGGACRMTVMGGADSRGRNVREAAVALEREGEGIARPGNGAEPAAITAISGPENGGASVRAGGDAAMATANVTLGLAALDRRLGGGLKRGAVHDIYSAESREGSAAAGFAAALAVRAGLMRSGPVLWVVASGPAREAGLPYPPGLAALGLDPGLVLFVTATKTVAALWALEEALSVPDFSAVIGEIGADPKLDLTALRRLTLRAARSHGFGLLVRPGGPPASGPAVTRWRVGPVPGGICGDYCAGLGPPAWRLELEKNRAGRTGCFLLEWNCHERRFQSLPTHGQSLAAPAADRSAGPARADRAEQRAVIGFRSAS